MEEYKQVILVRMDLDLPKGKLAAQVGHACVEAVLRSDKKIVTLWRNQGMRKIVLKVENQRDLLKFNQLAKESGLVTAMITDAGKTVVEPGTLTCVGIGPEREEKIDKITKDLKML